MTAQHRKTEGYERRREAFRQRILDAATTLIREKEGVNFSMRELASRADVSPATPFNHLGGKAGVLSALITRSLHHLQAGAAVNEATDPIEQLFDDLLRVTAYYADDARLYRPIFKAILGETTPDKHSSLQLAISILRHSLLKAQQTGALKPDVDTHCLAEQLESYWLGTLIFWMGGILDGKQWQWRVEHGLSLMLTSVVSEDIQRMLVERANRLNAQLKT